MVGQDGKKIEEVGGKFIDDHASIGRSLAS